MVLVVRYKFKMMFYCDLQTELNTVTVQGIVIVRHSPLLLLYTLDTSVSYVAT